MLFAEEDTGVLQLMSVINTYRILFCQEFPALGGLFGEVHLSAVLIVFKAQVTKRHQAHFNYSLHNVPSFLACVYSQGTMRLLSSHTPFCGNTRRTPF